MLDQEEIRRASEVKGGVLIKTNCLIGAGPASLQHFKSSPICCSKDSRQAVISCLESKKRLSDYVWYHGDPYRIEHFKDVLYFNHFDFREYLEYLRVVHEDQLSKGAEALRIGKPVDGVKGIWPFASIKSMKIEDTVGWDPFHTLMNNAKAIFKLLFQVRKVNASTAEYCRNNRMFPHLCGSKVFGKEAKVKGNGKAEKGKPGGKKEPKSVPAPWAMYPFTDSVAERLSKYFACVYFPPNMKSDFEFAEVCPSPGVLKGMQIIRAVECSMDFISYIISIVQPDFVKPYLHLFRMISSLFSHILSPVFLDDDVEVLHYKTIELVQLRSGMFPPSESHIVEHQMVDLPMYIRKHGQVKNVWSLSYERIMSKHKGKVAKGGKGGLGVATAKVFEEETARIQQVYGRSDEMGKEPAEFYESCFFMHQEGNRKCRQVQFATSFAKNSYVDYLVQETFRIGQCQSVSVEAHELVLLQYSVLYRLYALFNLCRDKFSLQPGQMYDWFCKYLESSHKGWDFVKLYGRPDILPVPATVVDVDWEAVRNCDCFLLRI